jgi:hypothetical protein
MYFMTWFLVVVSNFWSDRDGTRRIEMPLHPIVERLYPTFDNPAKDFPEI